MLYINSGHHNDDNGAITTKYVEAKLAKITRDVLKHYLGRAGLKAKYVPDNLDLRESIEWVKNDARLNNELDNFALSIHFNTHANTNVRGVECYYTYENNKRNASVLTRHISERLEIPDGGAIHDSKSYVGSLGWLRNIGMKSLLIEVCYLTNKEDMEALDFDQVAMAIVDALIEIRPSSASKMKLQLEAMRRQLEALFAQVGRLKQV